MPSSFIRLVVFCAFLVAVALSMPKFAPDLLASALGRNAVEVAPEPVAARPVPPRLSSGRKVAIAADPRGHFLVDATVNGRTIAVVVDTGASTVALTAATARRLGLQLSPAAYRTPISTANGVVNAASVVLGEVRLGAISVRNVAAVIVPGEALSINLLGMSFLSRLRKFEIGGGQLVLTE